MVAPIVPLPITNASVNFVAGASYHSTDEPFFSDAARPIEAVRARSRNEVLLIIKTFCP